MSDLERSSVEPRVSRRAVVRGFGLTGMGVLAASVLAACGGSTSTTTSASSTAASSTTASASSTTTSKAAAAATKTTPSVIGQNPTGKKGEVTWLVRTGLSENNWENKVVKPGFDKAYPKIHLNIIVAPWAQFDPKLFTLFAAGTPVDIWSHWGQSGFADYVHKGMVADLTAMISADHYDLNAFQPGLVDIYKAGGKYLGLPNDTTFGMPLIYNASMLQKAGITTPPGQDWSNPWTWAQMVEAAKKMTTNYGAPTATYGLEMSTDLQLLARLGGIDLYTWSVTTSGGIAKPSDYHADDPAVVDAVQSVYDLMYKEKVMPTPQLGNALSAGNLDPFESQKIAMNWNGGWNYWVYKPVIHDFKWVPAADPKLKTNSTTEYTDPWMLSSKSKDPESAWTFMKYLLSYDSQVAYAKATGAPPGNAKAADVWLQTMVEPTGLTVDQLKQVAQGALKDGKESYNHLLVNYDQIASAETQALSNVWNGKASPADGLKQAKAAVDAVLAKM
ncbi:MAG: sugar ABC transporter substrate-binding protein [Chloroflexi bacterium]|nr:sugar ABC transporter substrate-binding protein [Chloroflexota bacterium]